MDNLRNITYNTLNICSIRKITRDFIANIFKIDIYGQGTSTKLDELFLQYGLTTDGYEKNLENLYDLLDSIDGVKTE